MRAVRGARMAMIFQEPMTSLNPVFTVGSQVVEAILAHESISPRDAWQRALDLLKRVKIPEAAQRLRQYPHQLSGGMQQRVMIAMALACKPVLLIADEPTTALDVTVQAEILELLEGLKRDTGMSMLIITHDLGIVAETAERIYVMYAGRIVEKCSVTEILTHPMHPYTAGLLQAVPSLEGRSGKLRPIPGTVPNLAAVPSGCPFHPRCYLADSICERVEPPLRKAANDHWSACHFAESVKWPITDSSS
jgi:oligopeptide/dipeptide ABC transporter ATP-binding protein